MSYSVFLLRLIDGDEEFIPWSRLEHFANSYNGLLETSTGFEIDVSGLDIASYVSVQGNPEKGFSFIAVHRPHDNAAVRTFLFHAMRDLEMLLFDEACSDGYATCDLERHLPECMLTGKIIVVQQAEEIWKTITNS